MTEENFETSVKFSDLNFVFEEKIHAKELVPGFFEFNQSFDIDNSESDDPLWSYKLIFDTTFDWFSFTFQG